MNDVPAGWYRDPSTDDPEGLTERYWDGHAWNQHVRRAEAPAPVGTLQPPGWYQEPVAPETPDGQSLAGWGRRAAATLGDVVVLLPIVLLVAAPSLAAHWTSLSNWWDGTDSDPAVLDATKTAGLVLYGSVLGVWFVYNVVFLAWRGATPGKRAAGIQVRLRDRTGKLPLGAVLRRAVVLPVLVGGTFYPSLVRVFTALVLLDVLWPLWDRSQQTLHDKLAGTTVVLQS